VPYGSIRVLIHGDGQGLTDRQGDNPLAKRMRVNCAGNNHFFVLLCCLYVSRHKDTTFFLIPKLFSEILNEKIVIMKGEELKRLIMDSGLPMTKVAEMLGVSQQNLSGILSRDDIKTGTLEKVADAIGKPVSYNFGANNHPSVGGNGNAVMGVANTVNDSRLIDEIAAQRRLTEQAMSQNGQLLNIIENLTKK
jgi:transcriptional regulator with XRE-family HTH domain